MGNLRQSMTDDEWDNIQDQIKKDHEAVERVKASGFFDLEKPEYEDNCVSIAHNPPTHIFIPSGKGYRHVCPRCGKITTIIPEQTTL